jgi:hypothetical protein
VEAFRRLGVRQPERWAHSQITHGIPQLARASLLYWLWDEVVSQRDINWVDREIQFYMDAESRKPDRAALMFPHAPVLERLLSLGVTREELTTLVRQMQAKVLTSTCVVLDTISYPPDEVPINRFGAFELDEDGKPLHRVRGLHESVYDFDREAQARKAAANGDGDPSHPQA